MLTAVSLNDVGGLWKLGLVLVVLTFGIYFRDEIRLVLQRGFRFRRGENEFESLPPEVPAVPLAGEQPEEDEPPEKSEESVVPAETVPAGDTAPTMGGVFRAVLDGEVDEARDIFERLQATTNERSTRLSNEVGFAYARAAFSDDRSALHELEALAGEDSEVRVDALLAIGAVLLVRGLPDRALEEYATAEAAADTDSDLASAVLGQARALGDLGRRDDAIGALSKLLARITDRSHDERIYDALADLYQAKDDWFSRAIALSKILESRPNDANLQFRVGYAYAQAGHQDLALLHYRASLDIREDAPSLNNIGVAYENLDLSIRSISSYRRASELGHTLASANIALRQMHAGFAPEAREILKQASQADDPSDRVGTNLATLAELEETEARKESAIRVRANSKDSFLRAYASCRMTHSEVSLDGAWRFTSGEDAAVSVNGLAVSITWTEDDVANRLVGERSNSTLTLRHEVEEARTYGSSWKTKGEALAYSPDETKMQLLLDWSGDAPTQRELTRVQ